MELMLIPILLITGAALLHIGINGAPPVPHFSPTPGLTLSSLRGATLGRTSPAENIDLLSADLDFNEEDEEDEEAAEPDSNLELSDILLAELLSEMLTFREELADLKAQVATATAAVKQAQQKAPSQARKSPPARSSRQVKAPA